MKKRKRLTWIAISLVGVTLAAPNGTIIKSVIGDIDPYVFNALRFGLVGLVTLPGLVRYLKKATARGMLYSLLAGVTMAVAVICFIWAIRLSQASYVSIISLLSPVIFMLLSIKFDHGKVTKRAMTGVTLAAIGALTIVVLPIAIHGNQPFIFYPLATLLAVVNSVTFSLAILAYKRADDHHVPMLASFSIAAWITCIINAALIPLTHANVPQPTTGMLFAILYSGLAVAFLSRVINVRSYEHIGTGFTSALWYLETFLAILLPIMILGEHISPEMVVGGILILTGVYIVEHRSATHHRHHLHLHIH